MYSTEPCANVFQCVSEENGYDGLILMDDESPVAQFGKDFDCGFIKSLRINHLEKLEEAGRETIQDKGCASFRFESEGNHYYCKPFDFQFGSANYTLFLVRTITSCVRHHKKYHGALCALDKSSDSVIITDDKGRIVHANESFLSSSGYGIHEVRNRRPFFISGHSGEKRTLSSIFDKVSQGNTWTGSLMKKHKDGSGIPVFAEIMPMPAKDKVACGYVAVMKQTLFEEYELRNALFQSQKMEISGRIASGAFHNVNNFLSIISMSCHLLKKTILEGSEERELIQKISDSVQISSKIIRQIMAFLKEDTVVSELIDLNDTVSSFSPVLEVIVPSGVKFDIEYPEKSMKVRLVPSHLEQILSNIVLNAAKYAEKAKKIRISIESKSSIEEIRLSHFVLPAGDYALLRIFNDGKAMEEGTMDRIFRPFAAGNELHDGTGLGLFTVFEQIRYNNGGIDVKSSMGYGTEFLIYFPLDKASKTKKKQI